MRRPATAVLIALAALLVSHLLALTTESQAVAQFSWLLIYAVLGLAVLTLVDAVVHRIQQRKAA